MVDDFAHSPNPHSLAAVFVNSVFARGGRNPLMVARENVHGLRQGAAHLEVLAGGALGHFRRRVKEKH
jgi:hypothetical protein